MTTKYKVEMKNCYGITALNHEFSFENQKALVAIYAPNGSMKTSFARSFKDYSQNKAPKDIVYTNKESVFRARDQDDVEISREAIFVVDSINEEYPFNEEFEKRSTLLVSKELKEEYDTVFGAIRKKRIDLLKRMGEKAELTEGITKAFTTAVGLPEDEFLEALRSVESEVFEDTHQKFSNVSYKILFDSEVIELLEEVDIQQLISKHLEVYGRLLQESRFFKRGIFNHTNANRVARNLKDNGWFRAGHTVSLKAEDDAIEVSSEAELEMHIENEVHHISTHPTLSDVFTKVDKKFNTIALQSFRDHLLEYPHLVPELGDVDCLRRQVWIAYLTTMKSEYMSLLCEYKENYQRLESIINRAKVQRTQWETVISTFNNRFSVPFEIIVKNRPDAVLGIVGPQIEFLFKDSEESECQQIESKNVYGVLSNGERRALYILNIIFEVKERQATEQETLLIVDDIADSFDYKNKYAIVEYLQDIVKTDHFHLLVLTHNFDFYRTVRGRLGVKRSNRLIAERFNNEIKLRRDSIENNPMKNWALNLGDPKLMIACIPFVRNLADYCGDKETKADLTKLLHVKQDSENFTFRDLQSMFQKVLSGEMAERCYNLEEFVFKKISKICDDILNENLDEIQLENKIVLSIGIRIKAEQCIIKHINDQTYVNSIKSYQTIKLIQRFRSDNPDHNVENEIFERVLLMTSENIHMNSFMFEPILDMAPNYLHRLYRDVSSLSK